MSRYIHRLIGILLLVGLVIPNHAMGMTPEKLSLATRALADYMNYDICWGDGGPHGPMPYRFGKTVSLSLAVGNNDKKFYVWGDDLRSSIALHHPQLSVIYYGNYSDHHAAISQESFAYYIIGKKNWIMRERKKYSPTSVAIFRYTIPTHCVMIFPPSPEKTAMENAIVNTMAGFVEQVNRSGQFQEYPTPLHIVIANFDVDYPYTLVYIPETREVYDLALHDITDYFGDTFLKEGYPFNLVNYFSKNTPFVRKILKYGIYKVINIPRTEPSKRTVSGVRHR